jgi:hypothetical protein
MIDYARSLGNYGARKAATFCERYGNVGSYNLYFSTEKKRETNRRCSGSQKA